MNRFVTFCIKIEIALLVLAVISNTAYAAVTTETADKNPTMTTGTISWGSYTDTQSDDGATQDLLEAKVGNDYHLDCYYNLSTAIDESRIKTFEIGVYAWYTIDAGKTDSFTVSVWDYGTSSWDSTTITVDAKSEAHYTDTITMGIEHIRDSDGNIAISFNDNGVDKKAATLKIDYLYVKLTYTTISGVGTDKEEYSVGETITVSWTIEGCCGSGESYINIDYRCDGSPWCLHSTSTAATSDVSCPIPSSCGEHHINIYVYTASTDTASYTAAITEGDPWPKTTSSTVIPEFLIIAIPLLSAVAIYFLMRRSKKKGSKII